MREIELGRCRRLNWRVTHSKIGEVTAHGQFMIVYYKII